MGGGHELLGNLQIVADGFVFCFLYFFFFFFEVWGGEDFILGEHLFSYLCGYRKGYSIQKALTSMLEKWRLFIDKKVLQVIYNRLE